MDEMTKEQLPVPVLPARGARAGEISTASLQSVRRCAGGYHTTAVTPAMAYCFPTYDGQHNMYLEPLASSCVVDLFGTRTAGSVQP
jgi:hypothetical protein